MDEHSTDDRWRAVLTEGAPVFSGCFACKTERGRCELISEEYGLEYGCAACGDYSRYADGRWYS